jgi:hypothetical protein
MRGRSPGTAALPLLAVGVLGSCRDFYVVPGAVPPPDGGAADADPPADSAAAGDGAPRRGFCASAPGLTFCDDFDDPARALSGWTREVQKGEGGSLGFVEGFEAPSPPRALEVTQDVGNAGAGAFERFLQLRRPALRGAVTVSCAVRVDRLEGGGFNALSVGQGNLAVVIARYPERWVVREELVDGSATEPRRTLLTVPVALGEWRRVEVTLSVRSRSLRVAFDGDGVLDHALLPAAAVEGTELELGVGITYAASPGRLTVRYDNVALTAD